MADEEQTTDKALLAAAELLREAGWGVEPPGRLRFGCHLELWAMPKGTEPDSCVIDDGDRNGCIYAKKIKRKEQCKYWRRITPQSIKEAHNGD